MKKSAILMNKVLDAWEAAQALPSSNEREAIFEKLGNLSQAVLDHCDESTKRGNEHVTH